MLDRPAVVVPLAIMLAGTAWQAARAEDSVTQHADSGSCARSAFRVLIDVGHTATSPGADSARGVPEYEFNLKLADVVAQSLREAGFDNTVRLVTSGTRMASLFSMPKPSLWPSALYALHDMQRVTLSTAADDTGAAVMCYNKWLITARCRAG
jgi:hypothetical protein